MNEFKVGDIVKVVLAVDYSESGGIAWVYPAMDRAISRTGTIVDTVEKGVKIKFSGEGVAALNVQGWTYPFDSLVLVDSTTETSDDMKYDGGKPKAGTLYEYFPNALISVAEVSTFGIKKYERGSFHDVPNGLERYTDAMHRHLLLEQAGEEFDDESELRHAAHAAWGALCRLEFILRGTV